MLKVEWKKCKWFKMSIQYLGHVIENGQVRPAPQKIEVLFKYERPRTIRQLQSFLGLANFYRRFIKGFAAIASPLYKSTEKGKKFEWSEECQLSFDNLRIILTTPSTDGRNGVLILPNFEEPFRLEIDASDNSAGAVLSQKCKGEYRPVLYFSKRFNKAQENTRHLKDNY